MRTKNAKRLWPVPATLAVMALAALLAFGLLATTGAQPAAAQDADCEIKIASSNADQNEAISIEDIAAASRPTDGTAKDLACEAAGDTATIKFVGPAGNPPTNDPIEIYVLVEDKSGDLSFYGNGVTWQKEDAGTAPNIRRRGTFYESDAADAADAKPTKYFEHNIEVPRAKRSGGRFVRQSATLSVKGEGKVHVYLPADYDTDIVQDFANDDCAPSNCSTTVDDPPTKPPKATKFGTNQPSANADNGDSGTINITFLGAPAIGKDLDTDYNKKLDDEINLQCVVNDTDDTNDRKLVGEHATDCGQVDPPGDALSTGAWDDSTLVTDAEESRSKLVVVGGSNTPATSTLIDGSTVTHNMGDVNTATIHAVVDDAKGNPLEDMEVSFTATTNPSGIIRARDEEDEVDTEEIGSAVGTDIAAIDAVASYTLTGLDEIEGSYTISVEVMVGSLKLGTVVLSRAGEPAELKAGVFNIECFTKGDEDDYSEATFNAKNKGCDASGMADRFGAGEMFVVKAHLEDSRGIVVGVSDDLDSELANEDDDLLGDANMVTIENPVEGKTMPRAWVYTVDKDATLGEHMITVSTDEQNVDDEDIDDVTLTVIVAGPPHSLEIEGDANIPLNGSVTYTVTGKDMIGGIPHLTREEDEGDQNDLVTVGVQPTDALVVGTNSADQVMLEDDGTAEFTVYASLDADDGDNGRIIARLGDAQDILPITFGATAPVDEETGMVVEPETAEPTGGATSVLRNSITVTWDPDSATGTDVIKVALFDESITDLVDIVAFRSAADPGIHTFTNVPSGAYKVALAAVKDDGMHVTSLIPGTVTIN